MRASLQSVTRYKVVLRELMMLSMSAVELRRMIKRQVDQLPAKNLAALAEYVRFLNRPPLTDRAAAAEKAIACGNGVNWRKVRENV